MIACLTVREPWATLIATGEKRVENRTWMPAVHQLYDGERLLIHAGLTIDYPAFTFIVQMRGEEFANRLSDSMRPGQVVAICSYFGADRRNVSIWDATGQWHWRLGNITRFEGEVKLRGKQGLFHVDETSHPDLERAIIKTMKG